MHRTVAVEEASMNPDFAGPKSRLERIVTQCWAEVLGTAEIRPDENFFDLGGTSLLAIKLHRLLQQRLGLDVSILSLFRFPSIRGFVQTLLDTSAATSPAGIPRLPPARIPPAARGALTPMERAARQREALESRRSVSGRW
jgi:Phosphopantetheine attachment site